MRRKETTKQKGMTTIELIVVLAIVAVVSAVIVFNYSDFRSKVTLRSLAQDTALAIRKAQTYATSIRSLAGASSDTNEFPAYGISLSVEQETSPDEGTPSKSRFVLFADMEDGGSSDGIYNNGGRCGTPSIGEECVESFSFLSLDRITKLCTDNGCVTGGSVDILFRRPAPDAIICEVTGGSCNIVASYVEIHLQAPSGETRIVTVWNTGQISVE